MSFIEQLRASALRVDKHHTRPMVPSDTVGLKKAYKLWKKCNEYLLDNNDAEVESIRNRMDVLRMKHSLCRMEDTIGEMQETLCAVSRHNDTLAFKTRLLVFIDDFLPQHEQDMTDMDGIFKTVFMRPHVYHSVSQGFAFTNLCRVRQSIAECDDEFRDYCYASKLKLTAKLNRLTSSLKQVTHAFGAVAFWPDRDANCNQHAACVEQESICHAYQDSLSEKIRVVELLCARYQESCLSVHAAVNAFKKAQHVASQANKQAWSRIQFAPHSDLMRHGSHCRVPESIIQTR